MKAKKAKKKVPNTAWDEIYSRAKSGEKVSKTQIKDIWKSHAV